MDWTALWARLRGIRIPIIADLGTASWPNWREAIKEVFVTLFFSLMPLWLGLIIVEILTVAARNPSFLANFASSSDLGILSASLLGPLLYMMFREEVERTSARIVPRFPSGLWLIMIIIGCCMIATVIYSFTYLSGIGEFYDRVGAPIHFVNADKVASISWALLIVVIVIMLFASTIRNSLESQSPRIMRADTQDYVAQLEAAQGDQE